MIRHYEPAGERRPLRPVRWHDQGLVLLDQRALPGNERYLHFDTSAKVAQAITEMVVRGAPAIGLAAAYGALLAAMEADIAVSEQSGSSYRREWMTQFDRLLQPLAKSRPTAVNLAWALAQMQAAAQRWADQGGQSPVGRLKQVADALVAADIEQCERMAATGAEIIGPAASVLTHCNAGALATGGVGTALGVVTAAWHLGRIQQVYVSETRPWLQGSRLTAWELQQQGIEPCLVVEGAVAALLAQGAVSWLIVGADRVAANGDVANKIGTYSAALHARCHGAKVMVVAPTSTIDLALERGEQIEIEQRDGVEITRVGEVEIAAAGSRAWNPVFDITPARLVDVLVTEKGVIEAPDVESVAALFK